MTDDDLRYPIGRPELNPELTKAERRERIEAIEAAPAAFRAALDGLDGERLETPYREGGWTVRQVAHHVPDSHLNAYVRTKWLLTEPMPDIKAYDQRAWADLPDSRTAPVEPSLVLMAALHERWVLLLRRLTAPDFARAFDHPEGGRYTLDQVLDLYAWHGRHHTAHIVRLRERRGW